MSVRAAQGTALSSPCLTKLVDGTDFEALASALATGRSPNEPAEFYCGWSPLSWAARFGYAEASMLLLRYGADPRWQHPQCGDTALHRAAENGHVQVVQSLGRHGAPVNACNSKGATPLHAVAATGRGPVDHVARALLDLGADAWLPMRRHSDIGAGLTAQQLAERSRKQSVAALLSQHSADALLLCAAWQRLAFARTQQDDVVESLPHDVFENVIALLGSAQLLGVVPSMVQRAVQERWRELTSSQRGLGLPPAGAGPTRS